MANNGYSISPSPCQPLEYSLIAICRTKYSNADIAAFNVYDSSFRSLACRTSGSWLSGPPIPALNCEIEGPPLNSTQQVQAVNAVFPAVLVALCVIWGFKQLYNTLISNPRAE